MLVEKEYNRSRAVEYAEKWALSRNPLFLDYTGNGGNCTNFVSQCLYAGSCMMNTTPIFGWYYYAADDRTASWTGVVYLYNFLTDNKGPGPYAREVMPDALMLGDVIQLGREGIGYYHTLIVTGFSGNSYLVSAQSDDAKDRPLDTYNYDYARYLHIEGVRLEVPGIPDCFPSLLAGDALIINAGDTEPMPAPTPVPLPTPEEPLPSPVSPEEPEPIPEEPLPSPPEEPEPPAEENDLPQDTPAPGGSDA